MAADAEPSRRQCRDEPARDQEGAILVKGGVITERAEEQLQRLAFDNPGVGCVVDHEMGEIRLTGKRAQRGEFGAGEADEVEHPGIWVGNGFEHRRVRSFGQGRRATELGQVHFGLAKAIAKSASVLVWIAARIPASKSA